MKVKKALVVYDSQYGNTRKIALAVARATERIAAPVTLLHVNDVCESDFDGVDLLVVGSPTQGGRPTEAVRDFIDQLPADALRGVKVAAFDTRFALNEHGVGLKLLMKTIGFAAERIATSLQGKGGELIARPEGFIVTDKEGPNKQGELNRARDWVTSIAHLLPPATRPIRR